MAEHAQPVVAVVGHIDHGKTTLLDFIRKSAVAAREAGGITQRVSAYEIGHKTPDGERFITFIDTPGHEAFQSMRKRSANAADIAILIVAADDGVKPQTIEAKKAIEEAGVPMIVCFTKIDKDTANLDRAKESVLREGLYLEGLGGDVPWAAVSGKTGDGVPELLDLILLVAEVQGLASKPEAPFKGVVIETARDARTGISATVIVKEGTLKTGAYALTTGAYAPLRSIENFMGERVDSITCGKPVRITGWTSEPAVGAEIRVVESKKDAEEAATVARTVAPLREVSDGASEKTVVRIVLKADTAGSLEALRYELAKITHPDVDVLIADAGTGTVNENDVKVLIGFSPALILGFGVKVDPSAKDLAERQHIPLETRAIIYELSEWFAAEIKKHVPDRSAEAITGVAKILKHFSTTGNKHVIGGKVEEGVLKKNDVVTIFRRGIEVGMGKVVNLQLQKANADSVSAGMECGMQVDSKADIVGGDTLQAGGVKRRSE